MLQGQAAARAATIRTGALVGLDALLAPRGLVSQALCEHSGFDPALLRQPEARIDVHRFFEVLERAARGARDPALGLKLGYSQSVRSMGRVSDILLNERTLVEAAAAGARCLFLHQEGASLEIERAAGQVAISYRCAGIAAEDMRQDAELSLAKMLHFARSASGRPDLAPTAVHFRHRAPADTGPQRRLFRAPVRYGQPRDALVFPESLLKLRLDAACAAVAEARGARDFEGQVRQEILRGLAAGAVAAPAVAARLGLSERTLQRRLQALALSFSELVERARLELARRYLAQDGLSLTEIGERLGYSELSAFSRAFRRWAGECPQRYRERRLVKPAA